MEANRHFSEVLSRTIRFFIVNSVHYLSTLSRICIGQPKIVFVGGPNCLWEQ